MEISFYQIFCNFHRFAELFLRGPFQSRRAIFNNLFLKKYLRVFLYSHLTMFGCARTSGLYHEITIQLIVKHFKVYSLPVPVRKISEELQWTDNYNLYER